MRALPTLSVDDGPRFHLDVPIIKLTECVTQAIKASDVSSTPLVVKTTDGETHETRPTSIEPNGAWGLRSPDTDLGNQPTAQVAGSTNTGKHPEQQSTALAKSTKRGIDSTNNRHHADHSDLFSASFRLSKARQSIRSNT